MTLKRKMKRKWLNRNKYVICAVIALLTAVFACAVVFHSLWLVTAGTAIGFTSFFYGRHKLLSYIESELYG